MISYDAELKLLSSLLVELVRLKVGVGISDARPAVMIRTPEHRVWTITVDPAGEFYCWDPVGRFDARDPAGAAAHLAELVRVRP